MRTTLDIPSPIIAEAMKVSHQRTKTAVIVTARADLVRKNRIQGLSAVQGQD